MAVYPARDSLTALNRFRQARPLQKSWAALCHLITPQASLPSVLRGGMAVVTVWAPVWMPQEQRQTQDLSDNN